MKFSYPLLKQLVPQIKSKNELIEKLNLYAFEAEDAEGDAIDVKLPPNRVSDSGGHWGLAAEISAIYGRNFRIKISELKINNLKSKFKIKIQDKNLCSRYAGQYFENVKVAASPKWMQKVLIDCGMRPINNIVDIMNYAMLETGQPLHAFDYDKLAGNIIVRKAKKGEKIITLDNQEIELNENILIIADKNPLAIAGIKGGKKAEVDENTKRIIVEAANFDAGSVYKTSRKLGLITDASLRFSRGLSFELAGIGLTRAGELLKEIIGAKAGQTADVNFNKPLKKIIRFDIKKFSDFIGLELDFMAVLKYLARLGFKIIKDKKIKLTDSFLAEAPILRRDIETAEDLFEEVVRLYGYNNLKSKPPAVHIAPSGFEDQIVLKDKIKKILVGFGLNEVQNNSFISQTDAEKYKHPELIELENPISAEYRYLRPCLAINLIKNIESNSRFFDEISFFEIGNIFFLKDPLRNNFSSRNSLILSETRSDDEAVSTGYSERGATKSQLKLASNSRKDYYATGLYNKKIIETPTLAIILASKNEETFFRLKGIVSTFFKKIGAVDFLLAPAENSNWIKNAAGGYLDIDNSLKIEVGGNSIIGYLGKLKEISGLEDWHLSAFEIDLKKLLEYVEAENEYQPLSKYPSIMRDISILADKTERVGDLMQAIQATNLKFIKDVDLIDEYESKQFGNDKRSLAFRIIFQSEDKTLTDKEANEMMEEIVKQLKNNFQIEIR